MTRNDRPRTAHSVTVYRAGQIRVIDGANQGDGLSFAAELQLDDVYRLSPVAAAQRLSLLPASASPFRIAADSEIGTPGAEIHLDCCVTFMSGTGETTEGLVLVETDAEGNAVQVLLQPLGELHPRQDLVLVGISRESALQKFAQLACVSFSRGTMITLATGAQRAVEDLRVGDLVLTRDDGPQALRWIGQQTTRAVGDFAPVLIRAGTLSNSGDLVVSPDHRLFIYQREDRLGAGRSELLVRARHLVNGTTVQRLQGGFVDYFQMLFDRHQIIYAEGIAAESMLMDDRTRAVLPDDPEARFDALLPGHRRSDHRDLELQETLLRRANAAELLRKSSAC